MLVGFVMRKLFNQMEDEVKRQTELAREEARLRSPIARVLRVLTLAAFVLAGATLFYGFYNFPDAPIRQKEGGYAGKQGKPRTQEDFEAFILWEKVLFIVFPSAFVIAFASEMVDKRQRRKRQS